MAVVGLIIDILYGLSVSAIEPPSNNVAVPIVFRNGRIRIPLNREHRSRHAAPTKLKGKSRSVNWHSMAKRGKPLLELELLEEGLEPSRGLRLFGFSYYFSFRCPFQVRSLDFPLAMARPPQAPATKSLHLPARTAASRFQTRNRLGRSRIKCLRAGLARDCHHPCVLRFPRIRPDSTRPFPLRGLNSLKSDASADSATPAGFQRAV